MNRRNKKLLQDSRYILMILFLLLMGSQILAGILWMMQNVGSLPLFHDTQVYIRAAENQIIDEYMGPLYPMLIALAKGIEKVIGLPFYIWIYGLQLICAVAASAHFLQCVAWIKENGWRARVFSWIAILYFVTFPMLLQLHMAVLPYSLAASVAVLLLGDGIFYLRNMDRIRGSSLIRLCGLWMLGFLLLPEYGILLGIMIFVVFLGIFLKNPKWRVRLLTALLSTVICFGVVSGSVQEPGSLGRMQKTVGASMVLRLVRPYFSSHYFFWEERIKESFGQEELIRFAGYPEAVIYEFGPRLEEKYGEEEANEIYWKMAATSWNLDTKQSLRNLARDLLYNLCPPGALQVQLKSSGTTVNSWNYGRMQDYAPSISGDYVDISLAGWNVMWIVGILAAARKMSENIRRRKKWRRNEPVRRKKVGHIGFGNMAEYRMYLVGLISVAVWYTMTNSMQDYKKVMLNSFIWLLFVVKVLFTIKDDVDKAEGLPESEGQKAEGLPESEGQKAEGLPESKGQKTERQERDEDDAYRGR